MFLMFVACYQHYQDLQRIKYLNNSCGLICHKIDQSVVENVSLKRSVRTVLNSSDLVRFITEYF